MHSTYELVIDDDAGMTTIVPLSQAEVSIGRKTGNFIKLSERNVSRHHARLRRAGEQLGIEDLGSYAGVLVNGQRIARPTTIDAGDRVQIGDYHLALRRVAVAQAAPGRLVPARADALPKASGEAHRTVVEKNLPSAPASESRPNEFLPEPRNRAAERRKLWGIALGAALGTMLCGVVLHRQAAPPQENVTPPARTMPAAVHPLQVALPVVTSAPKISKTTANKADVQPPTLPRVLPARSLRTEPPHHHGIHPAPPSAAPPSADAPLTPEQAAELLTKAQIHYVNGEYADAIQTARPLKSTPGVTMTRAWRLLGAAACKLGDLSLINESYRHVDVVSRQYMTYVCQQSGVTLSSGRFTPAR